MSQPRTMEERVAALEAEVAKMRPQTPPEDTPRDMSAAPPINVRERMEAQETRGETRS